MAKKSVLERHELPVDLVAFLEAGKQLEYDKEKCEAGSIKLLPLSKLKYQRFPVETSSSELFKKDPHYPEVNSYLVLGVNLVASCTEDYDPVGLIIWLPVEKRYGVWDPSHCGISMFAAEISWQQIVANPVACINAGWSEMDPASPPMTELVPWMAHPYSDKQVYQPQPA